MISAICKPLLFIVLCFFAGSLAGQSSRPAASTATVKKVERYLQKLENAGYSGSVLVFTGGRPVISRGIGYSDSERKIKNSSKTIFDVGSITKQFTAAAILKLEMQGKLSTGDKITKYFPNVPPDKQHITIHQLLRHSSGLTSGVGHDYEKISEAEFLEKVFKSPLRSPSGTRFGYSNVGYSLLALIVEKLSLQTYESYLYQNLWKPAGMEMTGYSRPKFDKSQIAVGYRDGERWGTPLEKEWPGDAPYLHLKGNGGVLSTTEDLLKWDRALNGDAILSKDAKQKYYFPALRADEKGRSHYGYGWDVYKTRRDTTRVWHNGTNNVFYADLYRFIDEGVTVIVMSNRAQIGFNDAGGVISKIIFDAEYQPLEPAADNAANRAFTEEIVKVTLASGASAAIDALRKRKDGVKLLEYLVNGKGYDFLEEKKFKESIELFKLNTMAFPFSSNAFDSLGEAYNESGDKPAAIESYRKSVKLDAENENARSVLARLENNN